MFSILILKPSQLKKKSLIRNFTATFTDQIGKFLFEHLYILVLYTTRNTLNKINKCNFIDIFSMMCHSMWEQKKIIVIYTECQRIHRVYSFCMKWMAQSTWIESFKIHSTLFSSTISLREWILSSGFSNDNESHAVKELSFDFFS